jgi:hypothetical protein
MSNENNYYKSPFLFMDDVVQLKEAIIVAQNYYGSQRTGVLDRDAYIEARINDLERVLNKLDSASWKELPTPPKEI